MNWVREFELLMPIDQVALRFHFKKQNTHHLEADNAFYNLHEASRKDLECMCIAKYWQKTIQTSNLHHLFSVSQHAEARPNTIQLVINLLHSIKKHVSLPVGQTQQTEP